ncbi:uncharacterized protein LOC127750342, partial [Frankliniella occidentalis]|uniref:Uncharacterized protein LOC127750342 n=1 Tax=Frankliniella occidentalis TaxID=133901 RepID=A0A9C6X268_FRAOC
MIFVEGSASPPSPFVHGPYKRDLSALRDSKIRELSKLMDPDKSKQQLAEEVRRLRLQWAERADRAEPETPGAVRAGELVADGTGTLTDNERSLASVGTPVASSTLLAALPPPSVSSVLAPVVAQASSAAGPAGPVAGPSSRDDTSAALLIIRGNGVQELLRSVEHLLSQPDLQSVRGCPEHRVVQGAAASMRPRCSTSQSLSRPEKKPSGSTDSNLGVVQTISSDSSASDDNRRPNEPALRHFNSKKSACDWRTSLPSTSRA